MSFVGLVDCNSFYCSCEAVFRPQVRNRPVVVLSNNDGCVISLNQKAKETPGIEMGVPYFKIKDVIKKYNVGVFSSNYTLYDNMSKRVMEILRGFTSNLEVYSVDEAFMDLDGYDYFDLMEYGKKIRSEVLKQTGLPVAVGISTTKVLSKMANRLAKKNSGVLVLKDEEAIDEALRQFPVRDVWGVGRKSALKLNMLGIKTAFDFKYYRQDHIIQKLLTKTGRQVQDELRGIHCLDMEHAEDKKNIGTTRSFGCQVFTKQELREALAEFATHATEKLRKQKSVCFSLTAFIQTNPSKDVPQYYGSGNINFTSGTSDTLKIIKAAHEVLDDIYRAGFEYKKGGVILNHLVPRSENQMTLFDEDTEDNESLSSVVDLINKRYGSDTIKSAACGLSQRWRTIADFKSARYTTAWDEILSIKV